MSQPPQPPRRPLYRQFVSLLLVPVVLAFLLAAAGAMVIGYQSELAKQRARHQETMRVYGQSLAKPLHECDSIALDTVFQALARRHTVAYVRLKSHCSDQPQTIGTTSDSSGLSPLIQTLILYRDATGRQIEVGELSAQFHMTSIASAVMDMLWRYLLIFIAIVGVMLAGAVQGFRRVVGQPLARFGAAIRTGIGPESQAPRIPKTEATRRNDELGDVMAAYDGLMLELDSRYSRQEALAQCASLLLATSSGDDTLLVKVLERVRLAVAAGRLYLVETRVNDAGRPVMHCTVLAGLPLDKEQITPSRFDAPSTVTFPVWGPQNDPHRFICADHLDSTRHWSDDEKAFLQTIADMIGAFLENTDHRQQLASAIDQLRDNEKALMLMARSDPLTGLGNRIVLEEELERSVLRAQRGGLKGYVLLIDLNHFKPINDTYGHAIGDRVLQEIAINLMESVRRTDTVIRLGGDEFVVIIEGEKNPPDLSTLTDKLRATIARPQRHEGHTVQVDASIGAACYPDDGVTSVALLAHADAAMYRNKQSSHTLPPAAVTR
ncbi:MAG: diguanylate cyclase [Alcaligenaceae bacterium]|nr:diguanylate cyclase [Alcaligenaceae bacterium]